MISIRLATREGSEITSVLIPPFQRLPEVLIWGERLFSFYAELKADGEPNAAEYREVFAYWIPPMAIEEKWKRKKRKRMVRSVAPPIFRVREKRIPMAEVGGNRSKEAELF